jgi:threonine dehydrogenase-like Zn-dependent dehydrogenase
MKRVVKLAGVGNIAIADEPVPEIGARQVLVRNHRTLISRGSEIGRRYLNPDEVDPATMGYSAAGVIEAVGAEVTAFAIGQRVAVVAPHAEYVVGDLTRDDGSWVMPIPDAMTFEQATFHPLATGAVTWAKIAGVQPGDTVVILGQGLVGSLMLQAVRSYQPARVIAIDALPLRCTLATRLGAEHVINAADLDPVNEVKRLTNGAGAEVVIDCVGGKAGVRSFAQAQEMCKDLGRIHLISLYHGQPLALDASKIQRRMLIGGYFTDEPRRPFAARAMAEMSDGRIAVDTLITHRFPFTHAKEAFDLLYERPGDAIGVVLTWD